MYDFDFQDALGIISDFENHESFINELLLVEEGKAFFDSYSFGYPGNRPLRFVQDNFKPMSVYDDFEYTQYLKHLEKLKRDREARHRKKLREAELLLEKQRVEALKRKQRREKYEKRKRLREEIARMEAREAARVAEKKAARIKAKKQKEKREREEKAEWELRQLLEDKVMAELASYDPLFPAQMSTPLEKKKKERDDTSFRDLREKYDAMYSGWTHDEFLVEVLGCQGLSQKEFDELRNRVWPKGAD